MTLDKLHAFTILHASACEGTLSKVPRELLTKANLMIKDVFGRTPLHLVALHGWLAQAPIEFLTPENLTEPDNNGDTPLSLGAEFMDAGKWLEIWITFSADQQQKWREAFQRTPSLDDQLAAVIGFDQHASSPKAWL